ncbi:MAG: hypothetical protein IPL79_16775 [Myxococcales bacterium]|nr:hypothetical protein [Myxococcales bacterium]
MTWQVAPELEEALRRAAAAEVQGAALAPARLHASVIERSLRYTSERQALAKGRDNDDDLAARAVFFSVADAPKLWQPLAELLRVAPAFASSPLVVLDIGAGCGAMSLGLIAAAAALGCPALTLRLVDVDPRALRIAKAACAQYAAACGVPCEVVTASVDVTHGLSAMPDAWVANDLVLAGSLLNELAPPQALTLATQAIERCKPSGAVIIIEPALRATSRALHQLRDELLVKKRVAVVAPCTHQGGCPMLRNEVDWCHQEQPYALPPLAEAIARVTGLRDGAMKYAYLVLCPDVELARAKQTLVAVVSRPQASKGKLEMEICGQRGLETLRRLNRHRADGNRALDRAGRGDFLRLVPEMPIVDAETTVERLARAAIGPLIR